MAQKASVARMASTLGLSQSAYARLAVQADLNTPGSHPAVRAALSKREDGEATSRMRFCVSHTVLSNIKGRAKELGSRPRAYLRAVLSIPLAQAPEGAVPEARYVDAKACLKELRALRNELSRIGNNVNQIAYGINLMAKKQWLSEREARPLFTRWADDTARAEASLQEANGAILSCMAALSGAESEFVRLGGGGRCP